VRRRIACASLLVLRAAWAHGDTEPAPSAAASTLSAETPATERERVVLLVGNLDARWIARARGQLSDLPVVVVADSSANPGDAAAQQQHARRLGQARGADFVAWLSAESPESGDASSALAESEVRIWQTQTGRLYRHRLGRPWAELSAEDRSAALEIAALTLRSAVRASTTEVAAAPVNEGERADTAEKEVASPMLWRVGLGASWQLDGLTSAGMAGAGAEFAAQWQRWSLGAGGSFGFAANAAAEGADLRLSRHTAFLQASYALLDEPSFSCAGLLRAGVGVHHRETRSTAWNALPLPGQTLHSALLAGGARGAWHFSTSQALMLTLAATWQLAPPRYTVERLDSEQVYAYPLWTISPALELGWAMSL
jgi:hypothetical protein